MAEAIDSAVELSADGLRLRPYREDDAAALLAAVRESIDSVGRWLPWCHARYGAADACAWIAHCAEGWRRGEHYAFAVFDESGQFCGAAGLNQRNREHNFMNLGYWVRASRQGQSIARRAARMVIAFAFERVGLNRVEIVTAPDNFASQRVAGAVGAQFEGKARNRIVVSGKPVDALVYAAIPSDNRPPDQCAAQIFAMSS